MIGIVSTLAYATLGLILMFVGYKFFDLITPYDFAGEIKEKNPAMGIVLVGIFLAIGIIVKATIY
ncbi:MAG: DUF350 domain-containing protein [Clostridium sp.]|uniref:DUF350 domain-containing protein n=1 Tax=Clostridium sp. TaxID=1506 RepID=UPI003F2DF775